MSDYEAAKKLVPKFSTDERWEEGIEHHPESERLGKFIREYNYNEQGDSLGLRFGGDGDNGEELLYALDVFFEYLDMKRRQS